MKLTSKVEDYLETIYRLSISGDEVGISDVARERGVTLPTVISAVNKLKEMGLVSQQHYGKIHLEASGIDKAREIYETHKALKSFLTEVLRLPADHSEHEACRMEHVMSGKTINRLVTFMDIMQNCPARNQNVRDNCLDFTDDSSGMDVIQDGK
nr:metal-dependent transcriptional regulator [candidate division Zixibacteria bacterium]